MVRILLISALFNFWQLDGLAADCGRGVSRSSIIQSVKYSDSTVVVDSENQLMWVRCVFGQSGSMCTEGAAVTLAWVDALNKARALEFGGFNNWRMPSLEELKTIVDTCSEPPMVVEEFVRFAEGLVWTSSANIDYATDAWAVDFATGEAVISSRDEARFVIFVRGLE